MQKVLAIIAGLIIVAMLSTPVLAIGPQKADNNPNVVYSVSVFGFPVTDLWLPSGVMNE